MSLFKDQELSEEFKSKGYVIVSGVEEDIINQCGTLFDAFFSHVKEGMYVSHYENNIKINLQISTALENAFGRWISDNFQNFKFILGHFIQKSPINTSEFSLHQDWSVVEEKSNDLMHVWIPLQDVSKEDGGLFVLPGSHNVFNNYRSGSLGIPFVTNLDRLNPHLKYLTVKKGEALIYHPALFHGSLPNISNKVRRNVLMAITEKEAQLNYYHLNKSTEKIDVIPIEGSDLLSDLKLLSKKEIPVNFKVVNSIDKMALDNSEIDEDLLITMLKLNKQE